MSNKRKTLPNHTRKVTIRFTPDQYKQLMESSQNTTHTLSEYIRRRAIGRKIVSKTDMQTIAQIHKAGVNLNQIARVVNREGGIKDIKSIEYQLSLIRNDFEKAIEMIKKQ